MAELVKNTTIKMKVQLEVSHTDSKMVEVSLWYGSSLDLPMNLMQELYDYQHMMKGFVKFTPRVMTLQCPTCVHEVKDKFCFSDGLYCLIPPRDDISKKHTNVTDAQLLDEVLFGRCVHEVYKDSDPDELFYFNYIYLILNTCLAVDKELK